MRGDALFPSNLEGRAESKNVRRAHANIADELQTLAERWMETVKEN